MTPEKQVQNRIIAFLKKEETAGEPLFFERRQAGGFSYKRGIPDLYAVFNGVHIEIEVKAINGKLSTMQEKFRDKCKKRNILYICTNSLDEFIAFFYKIKAIFD